MMDDEAFARQIQQEELARYQQGGDALEADLYLAQELQEAECMTEQARVYNSYKAGRASMSPNNKYEKVTVSPSYALYYDNAGDDEEDDTYDDDEYVRSKAPDASKVLGGKNYHNVSKVGGRMTAGKFAKAEAKKPASPAKPSSPKPNSPPKQKPGSPPKTPTQVIPQTKSSVQADESKTSAPGSASPSVEATQSIANSVPLDQQVVDDSDDESDVVELKKGDDAGVKGTRKAKDAPKDKKAEKLETLLPTTEGVLDGHTRLKIFKIINDGTFDKLGGVLQTGKEASVYHAASENGTEYAVKIYKTTLAEFKDRDKYLVGEWRFRYQTAKSLSNQKLIKIWAEKELRNLKRLQSSGLNAPKPILLKGHIVVMEFIGKDGWPAPTLAKAKVSSLEEWNRLYLQVVHLIRNMYQQPNLVHADLSEYNLLLHEGNIVVIDLAQAVDNEHPNALEFLRRDCENMTHFFSKKGVKDTLTIRQLFELAADSSVCSTEEEVATRIEALRNQNRDRPARTGTELVDEAVFLHSYIPRTLHEVVDPIAELDKLRTEDTSTILHAPVSGLNASLVAVEKEKRRKEGTLEESESESESEEGDEESDEEVGSPRKANNTATPKRRSSMSREERKQHKKAVKAQKKESRVHKHK